MRIVIGMCRVLHTITRQYSGLLAEPEYVYALLIHGLPDRAGFVCGGTAENGRMVRI